MDDRLFRKTSIERVSSPEQLNEYIRVTRPGIWVLLAAIAALLIGCLVWGFFGTVQTTVNTGILVDGSSAICYISPRDASSVKEGMSVSVGDVTGTVKEVSATPIQIDSQTDPYLMYLGGLSDGEFCNVAKLDISGLAPGVYEATIITNSIHPIAFIIR